MIALKIERLSMLRSSKTKYFSSLYCAVPLASMASECWTSETDPDILRPREDISDAPLLFGSRAAGGDLERGDLERGDETATPMPLETSRTLS